MNQTTKNIKRYKSMLPKMRERVTAMVLMLAISASLMVSVSFAWVTLSLNPEASGLATTISGNGSLEIALAGKDGSEPGQSQIGDSAGAFLGYRLLDGSVGFSDNEMDYVLDAQQQKIPVYRATSDANLTWGNLINLSDPSYGLDNIQLRPVELNEGEDLLKKPVYSVTYGEDGRVEGYFDENYFGYTVYDTSKKQFLMAGSGLGFGVRAVSSIMYDNTSASSGFSEISKSARVIKGQAETRYTAIFQNPVYIDTLSKLIESYADLVINNKDDSALDCTGYLGNLKAMAQELLDSYEILGRAYCGIAEMQRYIAGTSTVDTGMTVSYDDYFYTVDDLCLLYGNMTSAQVAALKGGSMTEAQRNTIHNLILTDMRLVRTGTDEELLEQTKALVSAFEKDKLGFTSDLHVYAADRQKMMDEIAYLDSLSTATWGDIENTVNFLVDTNSCTINDMTMPVFKSWVKNNITSALGVLGNSKAKINNGFVPRMEAQLKAAMTVNISIKITYMGMSPTVNAVVTTSAAKSQTSHDDYNAYKDYANFEATDGVAQDTYAMALDFWVRTNADACYMTLEGEFLRDNAGNILGYVGANRVWDELTPDQFASTNSLYTTQGSGSCYVFSCSAADYDRTIGLLKNFSVAFVNADGDLMAKAHLDTENVWANSGRYTVPLVLDSMYSQTVQVVTGYYTELRHYDSQGNALHRESDGQGGYTYYYIDDNFERQDYTGDVSAVTTVEEQIAQTKDVQYITALNKNEPTWITAVIYLDGDEMTNDQVMAATGIEGKLNIQFGDTGDLIPDKDSTLYNQMITVGAEADRVAMEYDDANLTTSVTVNVASSAVPNTVEAYFYRQISSQQGVRQNKITFTRTESSSESSVWKSDYTFDTPGTYRLAFVVVDGREYELEKPIVVTVSGYTLGDVSWADTSEQTLRMFSGDRSASEGVSLTFATDAQTLSGVRGLFRSEDGDHVSVTFTNNGGITWSGEARFTKSGTYRLETVYYSGVSPQGVAFSNEEYPVPVEDQLVLEATLGVTANVTLSSPAFEKPGVPTFTLKDEWAQGADVQVYVTLWDDKNRPLEALDQNQAANYLVLSYISRTGAKSLDTNLEWSDSGYYHGSFEEVKVPGVYNFQRVLIGSSAVTNADNAPVLTAISPVPPSYVDQQAYGITSLMPGNPQIVSAPNVGFMAVDIANSSAAEIRAKVYNKADISKVYTIYAVNKSVKDNPSIYDDYQLEIGGEEQPVSRWVFELRDEKGIPMEGDFELLSLEISQFNDSDGTYYDPADEENGWKVLVSSAVRPSEVSDFSVKVIANAHVNLQYVPNNMDKIVTELNNAEFMQTITIPGLQLSITDVNGDPIHGGIKSVQLTYDLAAFSWYSVEGLKGKEQYVWGGVPSADDPNTWIISDGTDSENPTMTFAYGGNYIGTLKVKMNDGAEYTINAGGISTVGGCTPKQVTGYTNLPNVLLQWKRPAVKITGVDQTDISVSTLENGSSDEFTPVSMTNYIKDDGTYAYLGFNATHDETTIPIIGTVISQKNVYDRPTITMQLDNAGLSQSTTFSILLSDNTVSTLTFGPGDSNGRATTSGAIGKTSDNNRTGTVMDYGGEDEIKTITMTGPTGTYTVTLEKPVQIVLIKGAGPSIQYVIDSEFTNGDNAMIAPAMETDDDGDGLLTVIMPGADVVGVAVLTEYVKTPSTLPEQEPSSTEVIYYKTNKTTKSESSGCSSSNVDYYDVYARTTKTYIYTGITLTEYAVTYKVVGWNVQANGETLYYPVGEKVPLGAYSGVVTATAVVEEDEDQREVVGVPTVSTLVRYVMTDAYVKNDKGSNSYNGQKISNMPDVEALDHKQEIISGEFVQEVETSG